MSALEDYLDSQRLEQNSLQEEYEHKAKLGVWVPEPEDLPEMHIVDMSDAHLTNALAVINCLGEECTRRLCKPYLEKELKRREKR